MTTPSTTESGAVIIHQHHYHYAHDPRMVEALDVLATVQMEQQAAAVALRTLGATTLALVDELRALVAEVRSARESLTGVPVPHAI